MDKYCLFSAGTISLLYTKNVENLIKIFSLQMLLKCKHLDFTHFFGEISFIAEWFLGVIFLDFT